MKLESRLNLPRARGSVVEEYLNTLKVSVYYGAWTISQDLEIVRCSGIIKNNGFYDYHKGLDDSESVLFAKREGYAEAEYWFTMDKNEAIKILAENLLEWKSTLEKELSETIYKLNKLDEKYL